MTTHEPGTDDAHDAWLREALRHAPDAELAPPPRLRAQILRAADEAARPRAAWSNPLQWLSALASHPGWAGGLASVFVATIVVVIWSPWSGGPDTSVAEAPAAPMSAASEVATVSAEAPAAVVRAEPAAEPRLAEVQRDRAAARPRTEAKAEVAAAAPPAAPAPPPATAALEAPTRQAGAAAAADRAALATAPATPPLRAADAAPLAAPRSGLRTEPDMWTWRRGGDEAMPADDALREWLDKLDAATTGRWERIDADPGDIRVLGTLTLLRDGRVHTIVRLEGDGVSRRGAVRVRASLDPATAASLAQELRQLAP